MHKPTQTESEEVKGRLWKKGRKNRTILESSSLWNYRTWVTASIQSTLPPTLGWSNWYRREFQHRIISYGMHTTLLFLSICTALKGWYSQIGNWKWSFVLPSVFYCWYIILWRDEMRFLEFGFFFWKSPSITIFIPLTVGRSKPVSKKIEPTPAEYPW